MHGAKINGVEMKKFLFLVCGLIVSANVAIAAENCFVAKENGKVLITEGDCDTAYPPQSTFKIPLSLMGFDSGIFKSEDEPTWQLPEGVDPFINTCKGDHNPRTWMRDCCLWYSRILTPKLGMEKFQNYVTKFSYGNMDLSGGITQSWVSNSLTISPNEQADFLARVVERKFPISKASYDKTKKIMFIQEMGGGWKLYGKTGSATMHGWFVGYIEKGGRTITFASHLVDSEKQNIWASFRARNEAWIKIAYLINELEK